MDLPSATGLYTHNKMSEQKVGCTNTLCNIYNRKVIIIHRLRSNFSSIFYTPNGACFVVLFGGDPTSVHSQLL